MVNEDKYGEMERFGCRMGRCGLGKTNMDRGSLKDFV